MDRQTDRRSLFSVGPCLSPRLEESISTMMETDHTRCSNKDKTRNNSHNLHFCKRIDTMKKFDLEKKTQDGGAAELEKQSPRSILLPTPSADPRKPAMRPKNTVRWTSGTEQKERRSLRPRKSSLPIKKVLPPIDVEEKKKTAVAQKTAAAAKKRAAKKSAKRKSDDKNKEEPAKKVKLTQVELEKAIEKKSKTQEKRELKKALTDARFKAKAARSVNPLLKAFNIKCLMKTASGRNIYEWMGSIKSLPEDVTTSMKVLTEKGIFDAKSWRKMAVDVIKSRFPDLDIDAELKKTTFNIDKEMFA